MTELGSRLKEARKAKGLSLDDLQEITKIQKRYLRGIEEGNYDSIPGKFYVRAFIKQYAEAVGLESEQIFEEFKSEVPVTHNDDISEQISRVQSRRSVSAGTSKVFNILPTILVVVFIVAAAFLIWVLVQKFSGSGQAENQNVNNNSSQVKVKETGQSNTAKSNNNADNSQKTNSENANTKKDKNETTDTKDETKPEQELKVDSTSGINTTYKLSNTDKFKLTVSSTGRTWILVKNGINGKTIYTGTLNENEKQTFDFSNESQAYISIGNVPNTEILVNDQKLEYANKNTTQKITIQFDPLKTE
ncbi:helix-turn-helix domain-containing protein [Heyndrickxia camelliae]|uniref:Helix-turn-helix domain-containing protein n=1 Tax=Heyndrickxia camelliae TaxID=1707093 RepID=A0A2N3LGA2_9BACI|nr:helix-turn-helix domain-containing protein [Heyndrickxia camelliae]